MTDSASNDNDRGRIRQFVDGLREQDGLTRRQIRALILVGMVLGASVPVLAAVFQNAVPQSGTIPYETNSGATVYLEDATNTSSGNLYPDDETVHINTTEGNATFSSSGNVEATVSSGNLTGEWTAVTGLDVTSAGLTISPEDKPAVTVEGDTDRIEFREMGVDNGQTDFVYVGSSGATTVTVRSLAASTAIIAVDSDTGEVLDKSMTDSSGQAVLEDMPNSDHAVELRTSDEAPELSNPQPDGVVSTAPNNLSVEVRDSEFPGDTVTVTFFIDGVKVDETTITANQEVETTNTSAITSDSDWSVIATDETGNKAVVNATVDMPGTLEIRNVSDPGSLIDDRTVEVTFVAGDTVIERETTDGTIDMAGLPVQEYAVSSQADEYQTRDIIVRSIGSNQTIWMLNTSVTDVEVVFQIDDATGRFEGAGTELTIQRPINQSGSAEWETIIETDLNADGQVPTILERGQQYRIIVQNDEESRLLGSYRATSAVNPEILPIGRVELQSDTTGSIAIGGGIDNTSGVRLLRFAYIDGEDATSDLTYRVVRTDGTVVVANTTVTDPKQRMVVTHNLTALDADAPGNATYEVEWWAERDGQPDESGVFTIEKPIPAVCLDLPVDPQVMHLIGYVAILSIGGLTVIVSPKLASVSMASTTAGIAFLGCAPIPGPLVGLAVAAAVLHNVGGQLR